MRRLLCLLLVPLAMGSSIVLAVPAGADSGYESEFLRLLNRTRAGAGLPAMTLDPGLSVDARAWSGTMRSRNLLFHTPSQQMQAEVARVVPDWQRIGENVGVGYDVAGLHEAFYASPGHRANILADFNRVGIGVVRDGARTWVTFRFVKGPALSGTTGLERPAVRLCRGTIGARTIRSDIRVPKRSSCRLEGTTVRGDVVVTGGATLRASNARISGSVRAVGHRHLRLLDTRVGRAVQARDGREVVTRRTQVGTTMRAVGNRSGVLVARNRVGGDLLCKLNAPRPSGGNNRVGGAKLRQCRSL